MPGDHEYKTVIYESDQQEKVLYMLETHVHTRRSRLCVVYAGNSCQH